MKIAIAQMNCMLGDIAGNAQQIIHYAEHAKQQGASLLLTPELSLCGYPPEDLLLRDDFLLASRDALHELAKILSDITVIVGHPQHLGDLCYNAASVLQAGKVIATYHKHVLPESPATMKSGSQSVHGSHGHAAVKSGLMSPSRYR